MDKNFAQLDHAETVIVGGGQSGLTVSKMLKAAGLEHVVLERGRIGESWRSQRWDSFVLNTPDNMSSLSEGPPLGAGGSGFSGSDTVVRYLEDYALENQLPVWTETIVEGVEPGSGGKEFVVRTTRGVIRARNVVAASGAFSEPRIPSHGSDVSSDVLTVHAAAYRDAGSLPEGAVLVVGSAQTGAQIAEDLLEQGRQVFVATSKVGRIPRRYRGKDTIEWWRDMGALAERRSDLANPDEAVLPQHLVSGTRGGHTLSLQQLARDGVTLAGRLLHIDRDAAYFDDDLAVNVAFGDEESLRHRKRIDDYVVSSGVSAPPSEPEPAEAPFHTFPETSRSLHLRHERVSTVIWATGFLPSRGWLSAFRVFSPGMAYYECGIEPTAGLFVLGVPWLTHRASGIIYGAATDARVIVRRIHERAS